MKTKIKIALVVTVICLFIMHHYEVALHAIGVNDKLDMNFGYTFSQMSDVFQILHRNDSRIYFAYITVDFIFIISYLFVQKYFLMYAIGENAINTKWKYLLYTVYFRAAFDVMEDLMFLYLFFYISKNMAWIVIVASFITKLKFIMLWTWMASLLLSIVLHIKYRGGTKIENSRFVLFFRNR